MTTRIRHGNVWIDVSGSLERALRGVIERLAPTVSARIEDEIRDIANEARSRWPVGRERGRAHSRDLFEHGLRLTSDAVEGFVANDAEYAFYIKSYRNGLGGKSAVVELLRKPVQAAAADIAKELGEDVRKLIRKA